MLLNILLALLVLDCVLMVAVILMQRSEGGALGMGGGGGGLVTARGAGNLLTATTQWLAAIFFLLSLGITILAGFQRGSDSIAERLDITAPTSPSTVRQGPGQPAQSGQPAAPPLPDAAPPLPDAAPAPTGAAPTQAPAPGQ